MSVQTEIARIAQAKTDIKNVVNSKVANTITNQTIDAFPPLIDSSIAAYKNLIPWIEGSGSNFTIDNAEASKLDKFEMEGNTEQDSYSGKNMINLTASSNTSVLVTNVTYNQNTNVLTVPSSIDTNTGYRFVGWYLTNLENNKTYTLSFESMENSGMTTDSRIAMIQSYNGSSSTTLLTLSYPNLSGNFSVPNDAQQVRVYFYTIKDYTSTFTKVQIEEGSTPTSFEPYVGGTASPNPDYPQEIKVVENKQVVNVSGKNLFDINEYSNAILRGGGTAVQLTKENNITLKTLNKISYANNFCGIPIPNSKNLLGKTIIASAKVKLNNVDNTKMQFFFLSDSFVTTPIGTEEIMTSDGTYQLTATMPSSIPSDSTRIGLVIYGSNTRQPVGSDVLWENIQIEEGSTATPYEPYHNQDYETSLKSKNLLQNNAVNQTINGLTFTKNEDGTIKVNGTATAQTIYNINGSVVLNGTYIITGCPSNGANATYFLQIYGAGGINVYGNGATTSNINGVVRIVIRNGATLNNLIFKPMIRLASITDDTYEEFYDYKLCKIGDYKDEIKKSTGKNLLNVSNSYSVTTSQEVNINLETGTYVVSCTDITTDVTTGTSSLCNFYHSDNTFDQLYFSRTNKVGQITITAPVTKVKIYSSNSFNNSDGKTTTFTNLMIEKGSQATEYEPYGKVWYLKKNIGKVVLDGSEDWKTFLNVDNSNLFRIDFTGYEKNKIVYCNYYKGLSNQNNRQNFNMYLRSDNSLKLDLLDNRFTSKDDFKIWLSNNPVTVYYVLATPAYEEITNSTLINQLEAIETETGTNIFEVNNENNVLPNLYVLTEKQDSYNNWKKREGIN